MSTTHTPGPWKILGQNDPTQVRSVEGKFIADCGFGPAASPRMSEAKANARLVAAAPELLGALHVSLTILGNLIEQVRGTVPIDQATEAVIAKAKATLAKAKGTP